MHSSWKSVIFNAGASENYGDFFRDCTEHVIAFCRRKETVSYLRVNATTVESDKDLQQCV
jgi:hypothetical protein